MTMHTPGPWTAGNDGYIYSAGDIVADSTFGCLPQIEGDHNARLIAAAPDLLEALMRLVYTYQPRDDYEKQSLVIARAAIRKAKGE